MHFPNEFEDKLIQTLKIVTADYNGGSVDGCSSSNWTYFDDGKYTYRSSNQKRTVQEDLTQPTFDELLWLYDQFAAGATLNTFVSSYSTCRS